MEVPMRAIFAVAVLFVLPLTSPVWVQAFLPEPLVAGDELDKYWSRSLSGGPSKDGIPSIDRPRFETATNAGRWLDDDDKIIGLYHRGEARAYPQRLLVWHELVNDDIGGEGIAVSYCPLTGTALGFKRGDNEFGVSGRLVNSNLIMYDRDTDSYWPQILGTAVEGAHKGKSLAQVRLIWTTWGEWKQRYSDTEVLSRRTGYSRNYRRDPYGSYGPASGYYAEGDTLFPVFHRSDRYPVKHEVFGFRTEKSAVAVDLKALAKTGWLSYRGDDGAYLILWDAGLSSAWVYRTDATLPDKLEFRDLDFGPSGPEHPVLADMEPVPGFTAMWFAWFAFYPQTVVLDGSH
jgi:hypothetical protein